MTLALRSEPPHGFDGCAIVDTSLEGRATTAELSNRIAEGRSEERAWNGIRRYRDLNIRPGPVLKDERRSDVSTRIN